MLSEERSVSCSSTVSKFRGICVQWNPHSVVLPVLVYYPYTWRVNYHQIKSDFKLEIPARCLSLSNLSLIEHVIRSFAEPAGLHIGSWRLKQQLATTSLWVQSLLKWTLAELSWWSVRVGIESSREVARNMLKLSRVAAQRNLSSLEWALNTCSSWVLLIRCSTPPRIDVCRCS